MRGRGAADKSQLLRRVLRERQRQTWIQWEFKCNEHAPTTEECALERVTLSVTHQVGGPQARTPQHRPAADGTPSQSKRGAGEAGGRASVRFHLGRGCKGVRVPRRHPREKQRRQRRAAYDRARGYSPRRRAPRAGPVLGARGPRVRTCRGGRPAVNQLRGERPGAGVTGRPRGRAGGRGLLQFPVWPRTPGPPGTHRNSPPSGPWGKGRGPGVRPDWAGGARGKEVGEAWAGPARAGNGARRCPARPRARERVGPGAGIPARPLVGPTWGRSPGAPRQKIFRRKTSAPARLRTVSIRRSERQKRVRTRVLGSRLSFLPRNARSGTASSAGTGLKPSFQGAMCAAPGTNCPLKKCRPVSEMHISSTGPLGYILALSLQLCDGLPPRAVWTWAPL